MNPQERYRAKAKLGEKKIPISAFFSGLSRSPKKRKSRYESGLSVLPEIGLAPYERDIRLGM